MLSEDRAADFALLTWGLVTLAGLILSMVIIIAAFFMLLEEGHPRLASLLPFATAYVLYQAVQIGREGRMIRYAKERLLK